MIQTVQKVEEYKISAFSSYLVSLLESNQYGCLSQYLSRDSTCIIFSPSPHFRNSNGSVNIHILFSEVFGDHFISAYIDIFLHLLGFWN